MGALIRSLLALAFAAAALAAPAASAGVDSRARLDAKDALEISEAAIGRKVGAYTLTDSRGQTLPLKSFRGKPLVISLVYTSCSSVCPVTTQHVLQAVRQAREVVGPDSFAVLTFGFDARNDTPERLASFARTQGIDLGDWQLASADPATVTAFLRDVGFSFDAAAGGFEHITQTTILDAQGRVYRQVYGDSFPIQIFVEPLKDLVFGTTTKSLAIGHLVDRIRFLCTVYNPSSGAYEFDYAIAFGIVIGGLSLILSGLLVLRLYLTNRRLWAEREGQG